VTRYAGTGQSLPASTMQPLFHTAWTHDVCASQSDKRRPTFRVSSEPLGRVCSETIIATTNSVSSGNGCPLYSLNLLQNEASSLALG